MYKLLLVSCLLSNVCLAQTKAFIGYLYDKRYDVPIEFADVMFNGKWTSTDTIGKFKIEISNESTIKNDTISISHLSYYPLKVCVGNLKKDGKIYLAPKVYSLKEITINNSKKHYKRVGWEAKKKWKYFTLRTKNGQSLTKKNWSKGSGRVMDFKFRVDSLRGDSMLVKLNFYTNKDEKPYDYLVKDNIFYVIKHNTKEVTIDLKPYNIRIENDFWVGLQSIESWDNKFWGYAKFTMVKAFDGKNYYTWYRDIHSNEEAIIKNKGESCGYSLLIEY